MVKYFGTFPFFITFSLEKLRLDYCKKFFVCPRVKFKDFKENFTNIFESYKNFGGIILRGKIENIFD